MKTLIAAALLLALAVPAHAADTKTCTGRVKVTVIPDNGGLYPKGYKMFTIDGCVFEDPAPVLRKCPVGSRCTVVGEYGGDEAVENITSVIRLPAMTATAAQWKDIHELYDVFGRCGGSDDPELKQACDRSDKLQTKLMKQGFCFYKRLIVGKLAWHGPEEDRAKLWPEGEKQCYTLHDPAH